MQEPKLYECVDYIIYSPDSLKYITDNIHPILTRKIKEYKELFGFQEIGQVTINFFDDIDKFRNFIYSIRGESESLPEYATGTYDNESINAFLPNNLVANSPRYRHTLYMPSHELFHILYLKYILGNDSSKRIVWYDEGMAQFLSGEKDGLIDVNRFKNYYMKVKMSTIELPDFTNIKHGKSFCNELYNGYDLSYLAVRYLSSILSNDEFRKLLSDVDEVNRYSKRILSDMFDYYDKLLVPNEITPKV